MNLQTSLPNIEQLPESFAVIVDNISAISVTGDEADKYLQGQLTCDVAQLANNKLLVGGHCDAKGKMFSAFRLINHADRRLLIQSKGSLASSMKELQKFGVFAKVDISEANDLSYLALTGSKGVEFIQNNFNAVPDSFTPVITHNEVSVIYVCGTTNRYLVVAPTASINKLAESLTIDIFPSTLWTLTEIQSGFVHMNESSVSEYVPQMLNLQFVNGISFSKGCYLGQETVARMKYLGRNKKALFILKSEGEAKWQEEAGINDGSILEKQMGENWRKGGDIISHYEADDGTIYIQAVLANDTEQGANLRLKHHNGIKFNLMTLPYSVLEQS
ncbi:tRNA-modifying protein YgfZ [Thalassotalea fonticola]|uniref:tRNA-modifying protein YgfZ n=1 Tax=Thalassotalea fonticola TaxID=3065649 RepID=A0ABZ0GNA9_9GAMM|nr:tRNA-modifying protein YgfZ [Colwelliaceae bacterium S1-1]